MIFRSENAVEHVDSGQALTIGKKLMHIYLQFLTQHWILTTSLVLIILAITIYELYLQNSNINNLKTYQAIQAINHNQALVIDTRSNAAFKQGHIINAINVPSTELSNHIKKLKKSKGPIILVCDSSEHPTNIANKLLKHDVEVKTLSGGMRAWKEDGLPIIKN